MTTRFVPELRPSAYLSRASLARELDVSESTVDEMVRRRVLPRPIALSRGCVRWCWQDVQDALAHIECAKDSPPSDPFMEGARHATQTQEGRRDPS
jgi:predicted DNA-binding transcriptional regulator AlpA